MATFQQIHITKMINPHMFWFRYSEANEANPKLYSIESKLLKYVHQSPSFKTFAADGYDPKNGEIVLVLRNNKWIRGKIDFTIETNDQQKYKNYIVWSIDDGESFTTTCRFLRPMPKLAELTSDIDIIHHGGIVNCIPAEKTFSPKTLSVNCVTQETWSDSTIDLFRSIISAAVIVNFKFIQTKGDHKFGYLEVETKTGELKLVHELLIQSDRAKLSTDFTNDMNKIRTTTMGRFQNNNGRLNEDIDITERHNNDKHWETQSEACTEDFSDSVSVVAPKPIKGNAEARREEAAIAAMSGDLPIMCTAGTKLKLGTRPNHEPRLPDPDKSFEIIYKNISEESAIQKLIKPNKSLKTSSSDLSPTIVSQSQTYKKNESTVHSSNDAATNISQAPSSILSNLLRFPRKIPSGIQLEQNKVRPKLSSISSSASSSTSSSSAVQLEQKSLPQISLPAPASVLKPKISENPTNNMIPAGYNLNDFVTPIAKQSKILKKQLNSVTKSSSNSSDNADQQSNSGTYDIANDVPVASRQQQQQQQNNRNTNERPSTNNYNNRPADRNYKDATNQQKVSKFHKAADDEACAQTNDLLAVPKVMVHGNIISKPIDSYKKAFFCDEVFAQLEAMRLDQIYRIQSYAWPHILHENSFIVINSADTGKTMCYLPAICTLARNEREREENGIGPLSIIVCPSSIEVERIHKLCKRFLHKSSERINIIQAYGCHNNRKVYVELINGCELFITTPQCLARLINEKSPQLIVRERVRHLVIENIDTCFDRFRESFSSILTGLNVFNEKCEMPTQTIVTARSWHPVLKLFLDCPSNPLLCIGAYIEAAVYGRTKISLNLVSEQNKLSTVLAHINKLKYMSERTIIICNESSEVEDLADLLKKSSIFHYKCTVESESSDIEYARQWQNDKLGQYQVLVTTDEPLLDLKVSKAQNIIHYSLPKTWSQFSLRFSSSFEYYDTRFPSDEPPKKSPKCFVMLDENNNEQLPRLIEFLQVHGTKNISEKILQLAKTIKIQNEENRTTKQRAFCPVQLLIGKCDSYIMCKSRHLLTTKDRSAENIPRNGTVKLKIIDIISPTHYTARLLEHRPINGTHWTTINRSKNYVAFNLEFTKYFTNNFDNIPQHCPINIGDLAAVKIDDVFYRCIVLELIGESKFGPAVSRKMKISVKLIDYGQTTIIFDYHLLQLPKMFCDYPAQAVEIHISGIIPNDYDYAWDTASQKNVEKWISNDQNIHKCIKANVQMSIMNKMWVDSLYLVQKLPSISCEVIVTSIKSSLLNNNLALEDNTAFENIKLMANEIGILDESPHIFVSSMQNIVGSTSTTRARKKIRAERPKLIAADTASGNNITKSDSSSSVVVEPKKRNYFERWASLNENIFQRIFVGTFYSPNCIFVQTAPKLIKQINEAIDNYTSDEKNLIRNDDLNIGSPCLVKLDDKYNRAKIKSFSGDENGSRVSVFCVDFGQTEDVSIDDVISIPYELVEMHPYQTIMCKLIGIQPLSDKWRVDTCDLIYDRIIDPSANMYGRYIRNVTNINNNTLLEFNAYEIVMVDCTTDIDINIAHTIVEQNYGQYDNDTKHYLDVVVIVNDTDDCFSKVSQSQTVNSSVNDDKDNNDKDANRDSDEDGDDEDENWDNDNYINPKFQNFYDKHLATAAPPSIVGGAKSINFDDLNVDINFTEEEFKDFFQLPNSMKLVPIKEQKKDEQNDKKNVNNDNDAPILEEIFCHNEDVKKYSGMPKLLEPIGRKPNVIWQQSNSLIVMKIYAPDVDVYNLNATIRTLACSFTLNNELFVLFLNLFGAIDINLISHEIRGLYIIVRLVKLVKGLGYLYWPNLVANEEPRDTSRWLKYNYDSIIVNENIIKNYHHIHERRLCVDDDSSTSDDELNKYNPMADLNDDEHDLDPLADDFD